ncbi:MAG: hypothetical protein C3F06_06305 [Candidatus Methanoperedenaceae archaeon]|nr:MAG: hypothetical protein C3F06_06305 [Candidatus Methanoperedenaceae archaeon]
MGKLLKIALGILLLAGVAAFVLFFAFTRYDESSLTSNYNFGIALTTDSKLENPIFIVPMPVLGNETMLVDVAIKESEAKSDGWNLNIIETEFGKMLRISAKEFVPEVQEEVELQPGSDIPTGNSISFVRGYKDVSVSMASGHTIDTINATENEPLLSQKFNLTPAHNDKEASSRKTLNYDSLIYADYKSSPNATVEVFVELSGRNEWWAGGSGFNIYHERMGTTFTGEKHGWFSVIGELAQGDGMNLPASSPLS